MVIKSPEPAHQLRHSLTSVVWGDYLIQ